MYDALLHSLLYLVISLFVGLLIYYVYFVFRNCQKCDSDRSEELPYPNTCNPGYECKPSEVQTNIVMGDIVQEGFASEAVEAEAVEAEAVEAVEAEAEVPRQTAEAEI